MRLKQLRLQVQKTTKESINKYQEASLAKELTELGKKCEELS